MATSKALVARGPFSAGKWALEDITLRELREDELLVEIVASGICHTDLLFGDTPVEKGLPGVYYPRVLGHEGAGYVKQVGSEVTAARPGDPVLLSFNSCGSCHVCRTGPPSHCHSHFELNFLGERATFLGSSAEGGGDSLGGLFFGQSSFANLTTVTERSVVNVAGLGLEKEDLKVLAPLGCGLQTGSGTIINVAKAGEDDTVAVAGLGGVGLSAMMAAKISKCKTIIGIDRVQERLDLAKSLGATHTINSSEMSLPDLISAVREATDGLGASISIDTTASPKLVKAQVDFTRSLGKIIQVGHGMPEAVLEIPMADFMVSGKQYFGAIQGHSRPREHIPKLIEWYKEGKFPVEKLVKQFGTENWEDAVNAMKEGSAVKPVLVWN